VTQRDYSKFIREGEEGPRLNTRLIPRAIYVEMIKRWRGRNDVIELIAEEGFWLWDLKELEQQAQAEGRDATWAELAEDVYAEMDDREWWKTISAFEEHLITHFPEDPTAWAELLDPVYDLQEAEGWTQRQ